MIKIRIGKSGKMNFTTIMLNTVLSLVAIIIVVGGISYVSTGTFFFQTVVSEEAKEIVKQDQKAQVQDIASALNEGDPALVSYQVYDISNANSNTLASAPVYMMREDGTFEIDGSGSKTSGTSLSGNAVKGEKIKACAGNNTWGYVQTTYNGKTYNRGEDIVVDKTTMTVRIDVVQNVAGTIRTMDNGLANQNLSVPASSSNDWDRLEIRNNATARGWLVQYVYTDKIVNSNISAGNGIEISGGEGKLKAESKAIGLNTGRAVAFTKMTNFRLRNTADQDLDDFIYAVSSDPNPSANFEGVTHKKPILLLAGDEIWSGTVTMRADGDGCTNTNDRPIFRVADGNIIRSAQTDKVFMWQPETDADSPADVGATNPSTPSAGDGNYCTG